MSEETTEKAAKPDDAPPLIVYWENIPIDEMAAKVAVTDPTATKDMSAEQGYNRIPPNINVSMNGSATGVVIFSFGFRFSLRSIR